MCNVVLDYFANKLKSHNIKCVAMRYSQESCISFEIPYKSALPNKFLMPFEKYNRSLSYLELQFTISISNDIIELKRGVHTIESHNLFNPNSIDGLENDIDEILGKIPETVNIVYSE